MFALSFSLEGTACRLRYFANKCYLYIHRMKRTKITCFLEFRKRQLEESFCI